MFNCIYSEWATKNCFFHLYSVQPETAGHHDHGWTPMSSGGVTLVPVARDCVDQSSFYPNKTLRKNALTFRLLHWPPSACPSMAAVPPALHGSIPHARNSCTKRLFVRTDKSFLLSGILVKVPLFHLDSQSRLRTMKAWLSALSAKLQNCGLQKHCSSKPATSQISGLLSLAINHIKDSNASMSCSASQCEWARPLYPSKCPLDMHGPPQCMIRKK